MTGGYSRRTFLERSTWAGVGAALTTWPSFGQIQSRELDVIIRGGNVIDGTGRAAFRADVGIVDDRMELFLPVEVQKTFGAFSVNPEIGSRPSARRSASPDFVTDTYGPSPSL